MKGDLSSLELLEKEDLMVVVSFMREVLKVCSEEEFHKAIFEFATHFKYEYILYGYMRGVYKKEQEACIINISNPTEWAREYEKRGYYACDPVVIELEHREQIGSDDSFILWDAYDRELSAKELEVIKRRKFYGLESGFSIYENSRNKDFIFLISFGTGRESVCPHMPAVMNLVISHLSAARKRLNILSLISSLSERETIVSELLTKGYSNLEIADELNITEVTVKFHLRNIYSKLGVRKRQEAVSLVVASRYLCIVE